MTISLCENACIPGVDAVGLCPHIHASLGVAGSPIPRIKIGYAEFRHSGYYPNTVGRFSDSYHFAQCDVLENGYVFYDDYGNSSDCTGEKPNELRDNTGFVRAWDAKDSWARRSI